MFQEIHLLYIITKQLYMELYIYMHELAVMDFDVRLISINILI